jgi:hypothetical protein
VLSLYPDWRIPVVEAAPVELEAEAAAGAVEVQQGSVEVGAGQAEVGGAASAEVGDAAAAVTPATEGADAAADGSSVSSSGDAAEAGLISASSSSTIQSAAPDANAIDHEAPPTAVSPVMATTATGTGVDADADVEAEAEAEDDEEDDLSYWAVGGDLYAARPAEGSGEAETTVRRRR